MTRARLWGCLGAVTLAGLLVVPRATVVVLVGAAVFGALVRLSRPPRTSAGERHLVFTPGTAVAVLVVLLAFEAQSLGGAQVGVFVAGAVVALAALDLGVAVVVTGRVGMTAAVDRTEVTAGDTVTVTLVVTGSALPVSVRVQQGPMLAADPAATGSLFLVSAARVMIEALPTEVRSRGLCGLLGFVRRVGVPLPTAVCFGPRPVAPGRPFPELRGRDGEGAHLPSPTGDAVRGVRDYVPGDRRAQVHWKATARSGRLVVKEVEEPFSPLLELVLDLGSGGAAGEQAAARAAWYLLEARRRGAEVVLATWETGGARRGPVPSGGEAIRRLAAAVAGPPGPAPTSGQAAASAATAQPPPAAPPWMTAPAALPVGAGGGHRVLRVGPEGDTWS